MRLTTAIAASIVSTMAANALVIPEINELPSIFKLKDTKEVAETADVAPVEEQEESKPVIAKSASHSKSEKEAPIFSTESQGRDIIPHSYIVVFKQGLSSDEINFHREWVMEENLNRAKSLFESNPTHSFFTSAESQGFNPLTNLLDQFSIGSYLSGYTGYLLDETVELIRKNPLVAFVEKDSVVQANEFAVQNGAPWGLARVSHRDSLNLGSFNKYLFDDDAGEGVTAYVIDTGVNVDHESFGGRAKWGKTVPSGDEDLDGNGHGTHCAGTIGSKDYGVSKKADIVAVKVLRSNGSGSMSDVVKGVEFAAQSHLAAAKENKKGFKGSTANMSLGGGKSPALDLAVNAAVKAGIHFAVAAGNENQDACNTSPASAENAVTVGASTLSDSRAYFSNYGKCVDIFAPGLNILSTYIGSTTATATLSGTSMASPHICGLLTYFLSLQPESDSEFFNGASSGITPLQLKKNLISYSSEGLLSDIPEDTPNLLVFNGAGQNLSSFWEPSSVDAEQEKSHMIDVGRIIDEIKEVVEADVRDLIEKISN